MSKMWKEMATQRSPCPAQGCMCRKCEKPNHFAKMCRTGVIPKRGLGQQNKVQVVNEEESESSCSDDEYLYLNGRDKSKIPTVLVKNNNVKTRMIIDTGASTDILDEIAFAHINQKNNITLQPLSTCLLAYRSTNQLAARRLFKAPSPSKTDNATHCYTYSREITGHSSVANCYCSRNSQPTSEPHMWPYSTSREITYKIPYTVLKNRQAKRGGGQITYWWKNKSCHTTAKKNYSISHLLKSGSRAT